jgi:hypothetical protein
MTHAQLWQLIGDLIRQHPRHVPVGPAAASLLARAFELTRRPVFTVAEATEMFSDNVPSSALPGAAELGIDNIDIDNLALNTLRKYRKPLHFYDAVDKIKHEPPATSTGRPGAAVAADK